MKQLIKLSLAICLISFFWMPVQAVPAFPKEISYTQPDGTIVKYRLRGDEKRHWMESAEGYLLKRADDGYLMYAVKDGDKLKASTVTYRGNDTAAKAKAQLVKRQDVSTKALLAGDPTLSIGSTFPTTGKRKLLMLLVNYADTKPTIDASEFDKMMNQENYDGTGCFRDYFLQNSYGQLDIETTVVGWIQLPSNKYTYSTEDMTQLISDAVRMIDGEVDFTQFDNNGDGVLDGLSIIHQGTGAEVTGSSSDIWSHSGGLLADIYADGIKLDTYTIQPELLGYPTPTQKITVGVFCHEFGHNLGAPDFYDVDYEQSGGMFEGTGAWDLMSGGIWNEYQQPGDSPSHINMWQKMQFGWVTPKYLTETCTVSDMPAASDEAAGYIAPTMREGDYFVIENRTRTGFDRALPGEGLIIYHADEERLRERMGMNSVNADYRQGLYTVCASADGDPGTTPLSYGDINSAGAPFPGEEGVTEFSDATLPSTHSNDGKFAYFSLTGMKSDGTASFNFVKAEAPATVKNLTATARRGIVTVSWEAPDEEGVKAYRVFRGDELIKETEELQYVDNGLTSTTATYKVDVEYDNGLYSPFAQSSVRVPENKITKVSKSVNGHEVTLTWELNTTLTRMNPDIDAASQSAVISSVSGGSMDIAQRFNAKDLATYNGYTITSLEFLPFSSQREVSYKLRVYRAEAGGTPEVISERDASEYGSGQWRTLKLKEPVAIEPGYDYYIGFAAESTMGYVPLLYDGTTYDPGLGNLVLIDGEWRSDLLVGNVFIRAELEPYTPTASDFTPGESPVFNPDYDPMADAAYPLGFNVYRDNEPIGFTSTGIFIDGNVAEGSHTYGIVSLYEGENESKVISTTVNITGTGITETGAESGVRVYADGTTIHITTANSGETDICSADGKIAAKGVRTTAGGNAQVNVGAAGMYIVKVKSADRTFIHKVIVK